MPSEKPTVDLSGTTVPDPHPAEPKTPCHRCGRKGHFSSTCRVKKDAQGKDIESESEYDSDKYY